MVAASLSPPSFPFPSASPPPTLSLEHTGMCTCVSTSQRKTFGCFNYCSLPYSCLIPWRSLFQLGLLATLLLPELTCVCCQCWGYMDIQTPMPRFYLGAGMRTQVPLVFATSSLTHWVILLVPSPWMVRCSFLFQAGKASGESSGPKAVAYSSEHNDVKESLRLLITRQYKHPLLQFRENMLKCKASKFASYFIRLILTAFCLKLLSFRWTPSQTREIAHKIKYWISQVVWKRMSMKVFLWENICTEITHRSIIFFS